MSFLHPELGDLLDRLSIVYLKLIHAGGRPKQHWEDEAAALKKELAFKFSPSDTLDIVVRLVIANVLVWRAVDEMASEVGQRIYINNATRADLIRQLNEVSSGKPQPRDKL